MAKFTRELMIRKYAFTSVQTYTKQAEFLVANFGLKPDIENVKEYLLTLKSQSHHKQVVTTIRHWYKFIHNKKLKLDDLPYPRKKKQLPKYLSREEIKMLLDCPKNSKHQVIISLLYGCGLRMSELLNLKWEDIDRHEMIIYVRNGKGGVDRSVMMAESLLKLLEKYYRHNKSETYVLNGHGNKVQYSDRSVGTLLKTYAKRTGIKKNVTAHVLRHSFATHLLDSGTDMVLIQKLLGHKNSKTTEIYAHVSNRHIKKVKSPLELY